MIYHRIQGRTETGYKIEGNFKAIDSRDEHFSSFVDYISDTEDTTSPEMYFCYHEYLGLNSNKKVLVIGRNTFEAPHDEAGVFIRESQLSHKYIYTDDSYLEVTGYVDNFCNSMGEYEKNSSLFLQPHYSPFPENNLVNLAEKYGINEDRYINFVYALCTTAFEAGERLYITLPGVSDDEIGCAKAFISQVMSSMPMFIKRRFGFISYFPSNDIIKTKELPAGISCVFLKNSRRNFDNLSNCEFFFDNVNRYYFEIELNPVVEEFIAMISNYIFKGERTNADLFDKIDKLYINLTDVSFETVVAYYIRNSSKEISELLWANKILWFSEVRELKNLLILEGKDYIKKNIFSEAEAELDVIKVLLNVINDTDFQTKVAELICCEFQNRNMEDVYKFVNDIAVPLRDKEGKTYEEKTVAEFVEIFGKVLYGNSVFEKLATNEIIYDIKKQVELKYGQEAKTKETIRLLKWYLKKDFSVLKSHYFQDKLFSKHLNPIAFSGNNLKTSKMVYDFVSTVDDWGELNFEIKKNIKENLISIAENPQVLNNCSEQIKENNNEILKELIIPFAADDETKIIQKNIADKFEHECFMDELDRLKGAPDKIMSFLTEHRDMYEKYFEEVYDTLKPKFSNAYYMDVTNMEHINAFVLYLKDLMNDERKRIFVSIEKSQHLKFFSEVVNVQLLTEIDGSQNPADRIGKFIQNFFSCQNFEQIYYYKKYYIECLNNMLTNWHKLNAADKDEFAEIAREYLGVNSVNCYLDREVYKKDVLLKLLKGSVYEDIIKLTPKDIVNEYGNDIKTLSEISKAKDGKKSTYVDLAWYQENDDEPAKAEGGEKDNDEGVKGRWWDNILGGKKKQDSSDKKNKIMKNRHKH